MVETLLASVAAFCANTPVLAAPARIAAGGGLPAVLFLVGLAGGLVHCTGMCGPFVFAQITAESGGAGGARFGELRRLRGALLLPYQLGRMTTYAALGAVLGGAAQLAVDLGGYRALPGGFLALAALLFLAQGMSGVLRWRPAGFGSLLGDTLRAPLAALTRPLLADPHGMRGYVLGLALGFLPCGFLYGALTAAAGSGSAWRGALAMAAFALGTIPNLALVGYVGVFFNRRAPGSARRLATSLMLVNAGFLAFLAYRALA